MIISGYNPAQQVKPAEFYKIPFNEMYQGLAAKQGYYNYMSDKAEKAYDGLEGLMKNVDVWDSSKAATKVMNFQNNLDALKEKYPDFTDPMFNRELNKLVRSESTDPWWQKAMASKPIYEQWRKTYGESNAPAANKAQALALIDQASMAPDGATSLFDGRISNISIPEYSDYGKSLHAIGKEVKPDATEQVNIGGTWITKSKYKGVNQEKIFNSLGIQFKKDAKGNYLDDKGNIITIDKNGNMSGNVDIDRSNISYNLGAEDMRQLQLEAKYIASQNPGMSEEEIMQALYLDKAQSVANAYTFSETGQDVNANPYGLKAVDLANSKSLEDYKKQKELETTTDQWVYGNKQYESMPEDLGAFESFQSKVYSLTKNATGKEGDDYYTKEFSKYAKDLQKTGNPEDKLLGEVLDNLIAQNPQRKGESPNEYYDRLNSGYQAFRQSFKETELNINSYTDKKTVDNNTNVVIGKVSGSGKDATPNIGTIANKGISVIDPESGSSQIMSFDTFLKEVVDADPSEFIQNSRVVGTTDASNDIAPSGYAGQYMDAKGNKINFVITQTNYEEAKKNEPIYKLSQPLLSPTGKEAETSVNALNMTQEGMNFLELKPNQTIVSKRSDKFDKLNYTPEVNLYVRTYKGNTYSEEPYTIQGEQVQLQDFIDIYKTLHN